MHILIRLKYMKFQGIYFLTPGKLFKQLFCVQKSGKNRFKFKLIKIIKTAVKCMKFASLIQILQ